METERIVEIKDRLNEALSIRNMRQVELSIATGISTASISLYAKGQNIPKFDKIALMSYALNVSEMWLLGYDVPMDDGKPDEKSIMPITRVATITDRLNEALFIRVITQAELRRVTGISKEAITQYVEGQCIPKFDKIVKMSEALHVSKLWLLGYDVPMEEGKPNAESKIPTKKIATIQERLNEALSKRHITPAQFSRDTGIPSYGVYRYTRGQVTPRLDHIPTMSEVLHVNKLWLLGYDVPMEDGKPEDETDTLYSVISYSPDKGPDSGNFVASTQSAAKARSLVKAIENCGFKAEIVTLNKK